MAEVSLPRVQLSENAESGFANIVAQFMEQSLSESERKRRQAAGLRGSVVMTASDHEATITLGFDNGTISVWDGERGDSDAAITGPYQTLVDLIQGERHPLVEHLRGRIRVRSRLSKPFMPLRVHNLMKLTKEQGERPGRMDFRIAAAGALIVTGAAIAAVFLLT
jgi:putative sterol carrier protein